MEVDARSDMVAVSTSLHGILPRLADGPMKTNIQENVQQLKSDFEQ